MSPNAIADPEQRKEYEETIRNRNQNLAKLSRINQAILAHNALRNNLKRQLGHLVERRIITKEMEKSMSDGSQLKRPGNP